SVQLAILWNFAMVDRFVMPDRPRPLPVRLARFWLLNNGLVPLHLALLAGLVQAGHLHYLLANLVAIGAVFLVRYLATTRWAYAIPRPVPRPTVHYGPRGYPRVVLAALLTFVAFPATAEMVWDTLWRGGTRVPLLIPLAGATALLFARLRPDASEPD